MKKLATLFVTVALLIGTQIISVSAADNSNYNPIIKKYIQAMNEKWDSQTLINNNMDTEMAIYYDYPNSPYSLDSIGYAFKDINEDGQDELLIGSVTSEGSGGVMDAYALSGNQPVQIFLGHYRSSYLLSTDNRIIHRYSGGAMFNGATFYKVSGTKLNLIYSLFVDGMTYSRTHYYYSDKEDFATNGNNYSGPDFSNAVDLTESEYLKKLRDYTEAKIIFTPFSRFSESTGNSGSSSNNSAGVKVYRLYNKLTGEHLYTADANEANTLARKSDWNNEGVGWTAPKSGTGVYRLYSPVTGVHLFTTDKNEVKVLSASGWSVDNKGNPLFYSGGSKPVYRLYSPALRMHLITTDANEYKVLGSQGWNQEGVKLNAQ